MQTNLVKWLQNVAYTLAGISTIIQMMIQINSKIYIAGPVHDEII